MQKKSNKEELSDVSIPNMKNEKVTVLSSTGFFINDSDMLQVEIRKLMKQLDREKRDLEGQLNDLEWRLNNESRVSILLFYGWSQG